MEDFKLLHLALCHQIRLKRERDQMNLVMKIMNKKNNSDIFIFLMINKHPKFPQKELEKYQIY